MRGKVVVLAGGVIALILSILTVWSVANEKWVVSATAASTMASAILFIGLDIWRRVSTLRPFVRTELRRTVKASFGKRAGKHSDSEDDFLYGPSPVPPTVQQADVVGAVRLLQAQYVGRLDRMQTSVEMALAALSETQGRVASTPDSQPTAGDIEPGLDVTPDADPSQRAEQSST